MLLRHEEVDEEGKGCDPHERLDLGSLALKERDDHVGDKAQANAGRDGVGEGTPATIMNAGKPCDTSDQSISEASLIMR